MRPEALLGRVAPQQPAEVILMTGLSLPIPLNLGGLPSEEDIYEKISIEEEKRRRRFPAARARGMLRDALAKLDQRHVFRHGDVVRYKQGLESNRKVPCGGLAVFVDYCCAPTGMEPQEYTTPLAVYQVDCVIGVLLPTGAMTEYLCCSRYLEPAPIDEDEVDPVLAEKQGISRD